LFSELAHRRIPAECSDRRDLTWRLAIGKACWSPSYFAASCGGAPSNILKDYIQKQKTPL
jgi:putative transposase